MEYGGPSEDRIHYLAVTNKMSLLTITIGKIARDFIMKLWQILKELSVLLLRRRPWVRFKRHIAYAPLLNQTEKRLISEVNELWRLCFTLLFHEIFVCACNHLFAEETVLFSLILVILQFFAGDLTTGFIQLLSTVKKK